jgi:hypothetical protein
MRNIPKHRYGYARHLFEVRASRQTYKEFEAQRNGARVINVIPELDLAVMSATGNYDEDETFPERDILAAIIGSVKEAKSASAAEAPPVRLQPPNFVVRDKADL